MANFIKGATLRELLYGNQVVKTAVAFPATATATLFTVAGGAVLVTSLVGRVTTVVQSSDPVLSIGTVPTSGTAETSGIATTTVLTSAEVGTLITVGSSAGLPTALVVMATAAKSGNAVFPGVNPFVVNAGTITLTTGATKTGAVDWYLTYVPLDTGASVSLCLADLSLSQVRTTVLCTACPWHGRQQREVRSASRSHCVLALSSSFRRSLERAR
jgi:hypothetical protein